MWKESVKSVINQIRPSLQADGGDVDFAGWDEKTGTVQVQLKGMCVGCPMAHVTVKDGIEKLIKDEIKEVKEVIQV